MSSLSVATEIAIVEVCANVAGDGETVGLIAMSRENKGWTKLTPYEARQVAAHLVAAADETESGR